MIDIKIPEHLILENKINELDKGLLYNKSIIGLIGYSKSGKDYISNFFKPYNYHRVAFADIPKDLMNEHMKTLIYDDLLNKNVNISIDVIDFKTEDIKIKKILRPYMIWFSEEIRRLNGSYYWIDLLCRNIKNDKIIITDVRRIPELDIFKESRQFNNVYINNNVTSGIVDNLVTNDYGSLLFYVNQLNLTDDDTLTHDCIKLANESWLIDDVIFVDSRIIKKQHRDKHMSNTIKNLCKKHNILLPPKDIDVNRPFSMFP